ncbi:unnamed protein product [Prunus brigantina]
MSKAYDRVEWGFLEVMLWRLGFNDWWVELLMDCVSIVTYSIQVANLIIDSGAWNLALLTNYFCGKDKAAIASIALGSVAQLGDN